MTCRNSSGEPTWGMVLPSRPMRLSSVEAGGGGHTLSATSQLSCMTKRLFPTLTSALLRARGGWLVSVWWGNAECPLLPTLALPTSLKGLNTNHVGMQACHKITQVYPLQASFRRNELSEINLATHLSASFLTYFLFTFTFDSSSLSSNLPSP